MDTSLDLFYKYIYEELKETIPENILGKILLSTLNALHYLTLDDMVHGLPSRFTLPRKNFKNIFEKWT